MQGLYNHRDHGIANSYHHHHRHHSDRYQHPRYRNCQQCQILSPWLHKVTFGISGSDVENLVSRISLVHINMALSVPIGSLTLFTKQCCAVFFMATLLMASCCDARKIDTRSFDRSTRHYNRVPREVHNSSLNSTIPTPSHSTHILALASTDASSLTSSPTPSPHSNQPLSSATLERDAADSSVSHDQATKSELVKLLISTLEKLNAVSATDSTCLRLMQIVKRDIDSSSPSPPPPSSLNNKMFEVYLYFEEVNTSSVNTSAPANSNMLNDTSHTNSIQSHVNSACVSDPVIGVPRTDEQTDNPGTEEGNGTGVLVGGSSSTPESDGNGVLHSGRLSRTQIVVISTCSSIIGMFFIVAAILRIRNYLKRARLEQEMEKRPKFRSCSVALRGATQSMEQLRRDSLASKTSHQNSDTTKGSSSSQTNGSSRENSSASSPRHDPDTAPLLLLTGAAQASNPSSPTELQASLQYIDEDVDSSRKKIISSASVTNSAVHLDASLKQCGHCISEKILVEAVNSCRRGPKTEFSGSNVSMPCRQNGPAGCKSEGNVNPSFSSGSIGYILLHEPDIPDCGSRKKMPHHLNTINKTQGSAEEMPRVFAQTNNTDLDNRKVHLKLNSCSARDLKNNFNATKSNPDVVSQKHDRQTGGSSVHNDQQNLHKNYSGMERTTAGVRDTSASSLSKHNPGSLEKQIKADLSREHGSDQSLRADIGDKLYPLLDISSFGFSQPDVSLSSTTNQGHDFFGQKEYHYPNHQYNGLQTNKREALIDNDKVMQIAGNNIERDVTDLNVNTPIVETPQLDHADSLSNTDSSEIQIVNKIDNMTCASLTPANQVPGNTLVNSVTRHEQSVSDPSIQDLTTSKNVLETSRPNTSTTHQQESASSTELLDQNSNMLFVQALMTQSSTPAGEELQSNTPAGEELQSGTPAGEELQSNTPAGEELQSGKPTGEELQSGTPASVAPSEILQSSKSAGGVIQPSTSAGGVISTGGTVQSSTNDVAPSGVLQSNAEADVASSGVLLSNRTADVASSGVLKSNRIADVAPSGVLQPSAPTVIAPIRVLQTSTAASVTPSAMLHLITADDMGGMLQSSTADDVAFIEMLQSSTADDVASNEMLQSSTADDVASNEMLQSRTADDVAFNEILQSTTAEDAASNEMLQSSTADDVASNEMLQSSTTDDVASNEMLQSRTADDVASNEMLHSSTADDVAFNEILQSSTADDVASNEMLQSSTADDAAFNEMLQSSAADDDASNEMLQSSTADHAAFNEMFQSSTADDAAFNEMLQSSTADDVASNEMLQSSTADDVASNEILQSSTADDVASNEMLQSSTADDVAFNEMLQSSTAVYVASNEMLKSSAANDGTSNEMLKSSTADDVASNEMLKSSTADDVASNKMLRSSAANDGAPSGVLQSNKPTNVTQGLPIKVLTSIHTQTDEDIFQPLQEMADDNVMDDNVFLAENSPVCEAQTAFSRSFSDSLDTFTASDSEQSSCQELQSSAELSAQLMSQCSQASNDALNIDQLSGDATLNMDQLSGDATLNIDQLSGDATLNIDPLSGDASCRQAITGQGLETEPSQIIDDHQRNNNSLTDVNNRLQINGVVSTDPHSSSVNSNDHCHQLLSLTTHNQVLNSSTY